MGRSTVPENAKGQPGLLQAALFGMCPHCSDRTLFEGPAQIAAKCNACGAELAKHERGARLAGLLTIIVAALLITAAMALDEWLRPPLWVHAVVWAPLTVGAVLAALRLFKAASVYRGFDASN